MQPLADSAPVAEQTQSLNSIDPAILDRAAIPDLLKVFGTLIELSQSLISIDSATLVTTTSTIPDLLKILGTLDEQSQRMRSINLTTTDNADTKGNLIEQSKKQILENSTIPELLKILSTFIEQSHRGISIPHVTQHKATAMGSLTELNSTVPLLEVSKGLIEHHQELFTIDPAIFDWSTTKSSLSEQLQRLVLLLQANLAFSSLDNCSQANVSTLKMVHSTQQRKYYFSGIIPTACYNTSRRAAFRRFVHSCKKSSHWSYCLSSLNTLHFHEGCNEPSEGRLSNSILSSKA